MFTFALVSLVVWIVGFVSLLIYLKRRRPSPTERRVVIVAALLGACPGFLGVPSLISTLFITRMDEGYLLPLFVIGVVVGCPLGAVTAAWTAIAIMSLSEWLAAPRKPLALAFPLAGVLAVCAAMTLGIMSHRASTVQAMLARRDVDGLIRRVQQGRPETRAEAAQALGECGDKRAVPALIGALNPTGGNDYVLRREAAKALGNLGDPQAVPALIAQLNRKYSQGGPTDPDAVVEALGKLRDPQAVPAMIDLLTHPPSGFGTAHSKTVVQTLGKLQDPRVVPALIAALQDPRPEVRAQAAETLGQLRDPTAAGPLQALLASETVEDVRAAARRAVEANGW